MHVCIDIRLYTFVGNKVLLLRHHATPCAPCGTAAGGTAAGGLGALLQTVLLLRWWRTAAGSSTAATAATALQALFNSRKNVEYVLCYKPTCLCMLLVR